MEENNKRKRIENKNEDSNKKIKDIEENEEINWNNFDKYEKRSIKNEKDDISQLMMFVKYCYGIKKMLNILYN